MSLQFAVVAGPDKGRVFILNVGPDLMLGRSANAIYQLNDPRVSRNHCQVMLESDGATVICNGGSGGTLVNGQKVDRKKVKPGDVLKIGDTELRLQFGDMPVDVAVAQSIGTKTESGPAPARPEAMGQLQALVGTQMSHYDINMIIGTGRSCVVFHATDTKDDRAVALKVLQPEFSNDEDEMQRFIRGMKTTLPLRHPNIVTLYGAGKTGKYCWMAMEYVAGENLQQVIDRIGVAGMLDWRQAFRVALQIGRALAYAAGEGIVHRNVTPTNILRDATNKDVKLGDLMLAKALEGPMARQITRPGEIIGDVSYMSPERTRGQTDLDPRSDLYSLGATVYALLTGRPPCGGTSLVEKITHIRQTTPEKPTKFQLSIPGQFEGVVLKLLAKNPDQRYQSAEELVKELERIARFNGVSVD